jgi:hypothetical protein
MDPYLEHPARWPGLHILLIAAATRALQPQLVKMGYYASPNERDLESHWEPFLEVFSKADHRLITSIEFVSFDDCAPGLGHDHYQARQAELHKAGVQFVEIGMLRDALAGMTLPEGTRERLPRHDYLVSQLRGAKAALWPVRIRDRLPVIEVPLRQGEFGAALNLQEVLDAAYDDGAYAGRLDYTVDPVPPFSEDDAAWADQLLREKGLRL